MARLFSGLFAGRESLITHGTALAAVSDNVSNSNTTGFKDQRVEFSDMLAESQGGLYGGGDSIGNGVRAVDTITNHSKQGALNVTDRELDFAIEGAGFFVVNDGTTDFYTRAGNFQSNSSGNIVTGKGETLMGFTAESPDTLVALNTDGVTSAATATAAVTITGNLDSGSAAGATAPAAAPATFELLSNSSQFSTSLRAIDSLGEAHDVVVHFFHTGAESDLTWTAQAYTDAEETGGVAGTPVLLGETAITFTENGIQAEGAETTLTANATWGNGAAASTIAYDLSSFTGFSTPSSVNSVVSDGVVPGNVTGFSLGSNGILQATLDSGETTDIGTVALAKFVSNDGLQKVGGGRFIQTDSAGDITVAAAGSDGLGSATNGALEASTVDLTKEFVDIVRYQRGYQAGSSVVSTLGDIIRDTIGLAR